ncbi:MAG TPA: choice-of-anchor tandem repeat GloVer-containing protein [Candidatus Nitrosotalea sp.]|nr:choice-of-anchor tandem repeat GloVer-containing protein [Candidatus Nitrosotalea sp.]
MTPALPSSASPLAPAGGYKSLYSFGERGRSGDGRTPVAGLIALAGELYGTTEAGGTTNAYCSHGCGTVFKVSRAGDEVTLYRFGGAYDGATPAGTLVEFGGALWGTSSAGGLGSNCVPGCGTVFKLSLDGKSESVIYRFKGGSDGAVPLAGMVVLGGALYGTTEFGGKTTALCPSGCGTVFKVDASGNEQILHSFSGGRDGFLPVSSLLGLNGALYGTTQYGGRATALCATGCGTLFELSPSGTKKTLHAFDFSTASGDGAYPAAGPTALNGKLYGTTMGGGKGADGTVYRADPSTGAERVIHSFICCATRSDGIFPFARLTERGGELYGTTRSGGTLNAGTVFIITPSGAESVLYDFAGKPDGAHPQARVLSLSGALYGTTAGGGSRGEGSIFSFTP